MKFKTFIKESEETFNKDLDGTINSPLQDIQKILSTMDSAELDAFGNWLYDSLFDKEPGDEDFDFDELMELLQTLDSEDLNYVLHMLDDKEEDDSLANIQNTEYDTNSMEEIAAKFKAKDRNKKKNKRFAQSKA